MDIKIIEFKQLCQGCKRILDEEAIYRYSEEIIDYVAIIEKLKKVKKYE